MLTASVGPIPALTALPYYGGKSERRPLGRWVASQIPQTTDCLYVEPFAGMLGCLLQRPPSRIELVNDLNSDLVNWWTVVRDHGDALREKLRWTPHSREVLIDCRTRLRQGIADPVDRALAYTVAICQSVGSTGGKRNGGWRRTLELHPKPVPPRTISQRIDRLGERLCFVQIENRDALEVLNDCKDLSHAVIYVDPPYRTADTSPYGGSPIDADALAESLAAQRGRVAVSGYGDEWDALGWRCESFDLWASAANPKGRVRRTERLWMNYPPENPGLFG